MKAVNYHTELQKVINVALGTGINELAVSSLIFNAIDKIPEIKKNMPFGVIDESDYIKQELIKQVEMEISEIKRNIPFGVEETDYVNENVKPSAVEDTIVDFAPGHTNNSLNNSQILVPFGVDEEAYLNKFRRSSNELRPFGEIAEQMVENMANASNELETDQVTR